jgi:hypothetical protein
MATSIADLLSAIDAKVAPDRHPDPADAAAALVEASKVLRKLNRHGVDAIGDRSHGIATHGLAMMCQYTAAMFPQRPEQIASLVGAVGDVVGVLGTGLRHTDRWATSTRLADAVRHCVAIITASGPYDHIAELEALGKSASNLRRLAAANPPEPEQCLGLIRLIPASLPGPLVAHSEIVVESTAIVHDQLSKLRGEPTSVRQMLAACRLSEVVGRFAQQVVPELESVQVAQRWHDVGRQLVLIDDGLRPTGTDRILSSVGRGFDAVNRMQSEPIVITDDDAANLRRCVAMAPAIADDLDKQLVRRRPALFVPVGQRPLREARVGEFLKKRPFALTRDDLKPLSTLLTAVEVCTEPIARAEAVRAITPLSLDGPSLEL